MKKHVIYAVVGIVAVAAVIVYLHLGPDEQPRFVQPEIPELTALLEQVQRETDNAEASYRPKTAGRH